MLTKSHIIHRLQLLKPQLAAECGVVELALFGSYGRDEPKEDSDVDIFVILTTVTFISLASVYEILEANIPATIDVVHDGKYLRESLRTSILQDAIFI
jgi:uncharacterized protein